jgi:hypothetical protein
MRFPLARVFLFFALAFWPFWLPFSLWFVEHRRWAKAVLSATTAASVSWLGSYVGVVLYPGQVLRAHVICHSIDYGLADLHGFRETPLIVWQVAYLAFICGPLLLVQTSGRDTFWRRCGVLVVALYAFTSVWCFFAAVSSLLLALAFARLPVHEGERTSRMHGPAGSRVVVRQPRLESDHRPETRSVDVGPRG